MALASVGLLMSFTNTIGNADDMRHGGLSSPSSDAVLEGVSMFLAIVISAISIVIFGAGAYLIVTGGKKMKMAGFLLFYLVAPFWYVGILFLKEKEFVFALILTGSGAAIAGYIIGLREYYRRRAGEKARDRREG